MEIDVDPEQLFCEGTEFLENGQPEEAAERLLLAAKKGHAGAQVEMGKMYITGEGVTCSPKDAFGLFRSAAEQGDAEAQYLLGSMYLEGNGIEQSDKKAFKWLSAAAEQGETSALNPLGYLYYEGKGTERSIDKALDCFVRSSDAGDLEGSYNAGSICLEKEDYAKAAEYFELGSEDDPQCMIELGLLYRDGKGLAQSGEKANELFKAAYEAGEPDGLYYQSTLFLNLIGMVWEAADKGSTKALNQLARQYKDSPQQLERLKRTYEAVLEADPEKEPDYEEFEAIIGDN